MNSIRCIFLTLLLALAVRAQTAGLRGQVTDESGAAVPKATVIIEGPDGSSRTAVSSDDGAYSFSGLPPGAYTVQASATALKLREPVAVTLGTANRTLDLTLTVTAEKQELAVQEAGPAAVSTDAGSNASTMVLRGSDLDALSDNPDDLAADLQALAGPAAGPNGGAIYIDGFSGGELPPKNAIREIRINQNPFSPEYDRLGFGRIDIFTKPGTDKFHADLGYNFANDKWNSRNPYADQKAPFHLNELREGISGPLGKRASFNLVFIREWVDNGNAVNAIVLDTALLPTLFTDVPLASLRRTGITPRLDYQLSTNHTLSVRYSYTRDDVANAGTGGFNLVSRGYRNDSRNQTIQVTETAVIRGTTVNETRFQYFRPDVTMTGNTGGPAINVLNAFSGGGSPIGESSDHQNNYELQNYTSMLRGQHTIRFGVRARGTTETSRSLQNFNGTYTFAGGLAPVLASNNTAVLDATGQPVLETIDSLERYRRTRLFQQLGLSAAGIAALGGGPSQFTRNAGIPVISARQYDAAVFVGDDWRARPNLTVNLGLRYEMQTNIHDWRDLAPRAGVAWAPGAGRAGSKSKYVIRAGFGIFYDRFLLANTLLALRYNGLNQQQLIVDNPDFYPDVPLVPTLAAGGALTALQRVSPDLRAPYLIQSALAYERELPRNTTLSITYANTHGVHILRSRDLNAPRFGLFPLGNTAPVFQMESSGLYNQNQWMVNVNSRLTRDISLTGAYQYNRAFSDTDGVTTFPADPYSMEGEYGPAATDIRHRVSLMGTVTTIWGLRLNPMLTANSGPPFDITVGHDLYGDTLFNGRPGIASDPNKPGVIATTYGLLDPNPIAGETLLPRNFGRGPGQVMLNLRAGKTFRFGTVRESAAAANTGAGVGGGGPDTRGATASPFGVATSGQGSTSTARRFSLTISMQVRNLLNHNNPGFIIGNIASPLFGRANQPYGSGAALFSESANNRRLELQTRFTF